MVVVGLCWECYILTLVLGTFPTKRTPVSFREVKIVRVLAKSVCQHAQLERASQHDVVLLVFIGTWIIWELEKEGLIEGSSFDTHYNHMGVIMSDQIVFLLDSKSHDVNVFIVSIILS